MTWKSPKLTVGEPGRDSHSLYTARGFFCCAEIMPVLKVRLPNRPFRLVVSTKRKRPSDRPVTIDWYGLSYRLSCGKRTLMTTGSQDERIERTLPARYRDGTHELYLNWEPA